MYHMQLSEMKTNDELIAEQLRTDPELRAEWERTALARAVAVAIVRYRAEHDLSRCGVSKERGCSGTRSANTSASRPMFTLDDLLAAPVPLEKPLGRRPFKELAAILTRKPHRFLPPNVPELRVPADAAAIQLINEAFSDVEAIGGATGLAAVRATIERPQVRAAGRPLGDGRRDYTLGSAVAENGTLWRFVFLTVRVKQAGSRQGALAWVARAGARFVR